MQGCWVTARLGTWFASATRDGVEVAWGQGNSLPDPSVKPFFGKTGEGPSGIRSQAALILRACPPPAEPKRRREQSQDHSRLLGVGTAGRAVLPGACSAAAPL